LNTPWFRVRASGLGWTPVTWQGWLVTVGSALLAVAVNLVVVAYVSGVRR
jgi:hypothetical protein